MVAIADYGLKAHENARNAHEKPLSIPPDTRKLQARTIGNGKQTRAAPRPELNRKEKQITSEASTSKLKSELKKEHYCLRASVERETYLKSQLLDICAEVAKVKAAYDTFVGVYAEEKPSLENKSSNLEKVLSDLSMQLSALQEKVENEDGAPVEGRCKEIQELATTHEERRDGPEGSSNSLHKELRSIKSDLRSSLASGDTLQIQMTAILSDVMQVKSIFNTLVAVYAEEKTGADSESSNMKDALAELNEKITSLDKSQHDDSTCTDDISQISDEMEEEDMREKEETGSMTNSRDYITRSELTASMLKKEKNDKEKTRKHMLNSISVSVMQTTPTTANKRFFADGMTPKEDEFDAVTTDSNISNKSSTLEYISNASSSSLDQICDDNNNHQLQKLLSKEKNQRAADAASFKIEKEVLQGTIDALEKLCRRFKSVEGKDTDDGLEVIQLAKALAQEKHERALEAKGFQKEKDEYEQAMIDLREECDSAKNETAAKLTKEMEEMNLSHDTQISNLMEQRSDMIQEVVSLKKERDAFKEKAEKVSREVSELKDSQTTQLNNAVSAMNELKIDNAKYEEKIEDLQEEVALLDVMVSKKDAEIISQKEEHGVEVRRLTEELIGLTSHAASMGDKNDAMQGAISELEKKCNSIGEMYTEKIDKLKKELKEREEDIIGLKEDLLKAENDRDADKMACRNKREALERVIEEQKKEQVAKEKTLHEKMKKIEEETSELESECVDLNVMNNGLSRKITTLEKLLQEKDEEKNGLKFHAVDDCDAKVLDYDILEKEKESLEKKITALKSEKESILSEIEDLNSDMAEMEGLTEEYDRLVEANNALHCKLALIEAIAEKRAQDIDDLKDDLAESLKIASNVKSIQMEKEELEHTLAALRDGYATKEGQMMEELDNMKEALNEKILLQATQHAERNNEKNHLKKELHQDGNANLFDADSIQKENDTLKDSLKALEENLKEKEESEAVNTKRQQELLERIELANLTLDERDDQISHLNALLEGKISAKALEAETFHNEKKMLKDSYDAKEKILKEKMVKMEIEMAELRQLHEKEPCDLEKTTDWVSCETALKKPVLNNGNPKIGLRKEQPDGARALQRESVDLRNKISDELKAIADILQVSAAVKGITLEEKNSFDEVTENKSCSR